jgi:acetyl esterase
VKERRDVSIPADGTIGLRIYQPFEDGPHPVHLYLHGGGWITVPVGQIHPHHLQGTRRDLRHDRG